MTRRTSTCATNRRTRRFASASTTRRGTTGNNDSRYPVISANGNTVVFLSNATDLTANDNAANNPNNDQNVFAWVRKPGTDTGTVQLVTVNYEGNAPANDPDSQEYGTAENISVSANGDYIAYDSQATNLVPNAANIDGYTSNVYVRDLLTEQDDSRQFQHRGG